MTQDDSPPRQRSWYFSAILIGSILFLVGGVVRALFYGPVHARWLVAHAANELAANRVESASCVLRRAFERSHDIARDEDYWRLKIEILTGKDPIDSTEVEKFATESIECIKANVPEAEQPYLAYRISTELFQQKQIKASLRIMEGILPDAEARLPEFNNQIAYSRALVKERLDLALKEINLALKTKADATLLDTKAWVLYRRGEYEEALPFINESIRQWYNEVRLVDNNLYTFLLPDDKFTLRKTDKTDSKEEPDSNQTQSGPVANRNQASESVESQQPNRQFREALTDRLRNTAVLRFHRACILDALGRQEEAQKDYYWLDFFEFTETSNLF